MNTHTKSQEYSLSKIEEAKKLLQNICEWDSYKDHPIGRNAKKALELLAKTDSIERLVELTKRHQTLMDEKNVLISVYTNASGFLWSLMMVDSGTDLGWSDFNGDCKFSGTFTSYPNALENALDLVERCDLEQFQKDCPTNEFHWGNYADWLLKNCK